MNLNLSQIQAKNISQIFPESLAVDPEFDPLIKGVSLDSRQVQDGFLFVAQKGLSVDGRLFIDEAFDNGASAVLAEELNEIEKTAQFSLHKSGSPIYFSDDIQNVLGVVCHRFYDQSSAHMNVVGVTGTNGKTSVCFYLAQALTLQGKKAGVLGTVGNGFVGELSYSDLTTKDVVSVHQYLAAFASQQCDTVFMEVSSHSLDQGRVNGVQFDLAVLTNLSRDHMDYHPSFEAYGECKARLFEMPELRASVINIDDAFGLALSEKIVEEKKLELISISEKGFPSGLKVLDSQLSEQGLSISFCVNDKQYQLQNKNLFGLFNVQNLMLAFAVLLELKIDADEALRLLAQVKSAPGRLEKVDDADIENPKVFVDFAHTPDALESTLKSLSQLTASNITLVFGCGGDRDSGKRPLMAACAQKYCQKIVLTSDNPRDESQDQIFADMISGFKPDQGYLIEADRAEAIEKALKVSSKDEIVLIAGKGHEKFQLIKGQKFPFDDFVSAQKYLAQLTEARRQLGEVQK